MRFSLVQGPERPQNTMTLDQRVHFAGIPGVSLMCIQWAVIPMKLAFVCSTDQVSIVVETRPVAVD